MCPYAEHLEELRRVTALVNDLSFVLDAARRLDGLGSPQIGPPSISTCLYPSPAKIQSFPPLGERLGMGKGAYSPRWDWNHEMNFYL